MTSAENSNSEPPNLKILWGRILTPRPPYKALAFGTLDNAHPLPPPPHPRYKKPSYGPEKCIVLASFLHF